MSLGVLNNLSAVYAENNLNSTTNSLNTVLQQLSSGSKINSGADDAAGLSLVNGLQANQMALNQSQTNATEGVGLLQVADGALSQVTSLLNRAVTLATEASNGTLNSSQDTAANQEYQSILSEINNIGTTTTFNQEQVFGSNTNIYTGDSSAQGAAINDLNIASLSSSNVGDTGGTMAYSSGQTAGNVFIDLSNDGTKAQASDSLGASGTSTAIQVSYLTQGVDGATATQSTTINVGQGTQYANTAQGLISAINGAGLGVTASFGTAAQAGTTAVAAADAANYGGGGASDTGIVISGVGVGVNEAGSSGVGVLGAMTVNASSDTLGGSLSIVDSSGKSHSITMGTAGATDNIADLAATINAAGYGITAKVSSDTLTFTSAGSTASVSSTGLTDNVAASGGTTSIEGSIVNNNTPTSTYYNGVPSTPSTNFTVPDAGDTLGGTLVVTDENNITHTITLGQDNTNSTVTELGAYLSASAGGVGAAWGTDTQYGSTLHLSDSFAAAVAGKSVNFDFSNLTYTSTTIIPASSTPITLADTPTPGTQFSSTDGTLEFGGTGGVYGDTITGGGTLTIGSQTITIGAADNTLSSLASTIDAGDYGVTATYSQANADIVFTSANGATTITSSLADTTHGSATLAVASVNADTNAAQSSTDASAYYNVGVASSGGIVDYTTAVKVGGNETYGGTGVYSTTNGDAVGANGGMVSDMSGTNGIATISYTDQAGQSLAKTDLTNQTDAQMALTSLNAAISDVSAQDGYIGAQINTLNSASSVLSTQSENVQSAQNAVQATDYASATSNMSKYEILSQTGISALAQANSMQQEVTKLLQ
jgi:flagellin